jgi:hypothetical protein
MVIIPRTYISSQDQTATEEWSKQHTNFYRNEDNDDLLKSF